MLVLPGIMGKFLSYIPITIFTTLLASLFLSLTVNNALFAKLNKKRSYYYEEDESTEMILSEDDKTLVYRARKIQRFLSQPFSVAEVFTGAPGKYVTLAETVRGFGEILDGKHDDKGEQDFYMKGGIDEVVSA